MSRRDPIADFVASILVREGAWVVEVRPDAPVDGLPRGMLDELRRIPVRIRNPPSTNRYAFAERGAQGRWFFVWIPDHKR